MTNYKILMCGSALLVTSLNGTATAFETNVAASLNGGVASHINSQDINFGFESALANDSDLSTMNHTDFDGAFGGDATIPDILRIDFSQAYDLTNIIVHNRNSLTGGAPDNYIRLENATVMAYDASDLQIGVVGTISGAGGGTTHSFDNDGNGYTNVSYITLTNNNWIHIAEFEAFFFDDSIILGDVDGDGDVDLVDYGFLRDNFNLGTTLAEGDVDEDGDVDLDDYAILEVEFEKHNGGASLASSIPEPASLLMLGLGGLALLKRSK